ncbi:hypothetical protein LSCM4_01559 [Leishmania orientalis]|uniref:RanBP2-type domain-containing protein n=1 Tax=Leishmania orientalis TaxID=2249476 RepID=A0A836GY69_9TRYP|nr:hypothetical protein LSCM4_01559 [Leishmania orientalis]
MKLRVDTALALAALCWPPAAGGCPGGASLQWWAMRRVCRTPHEAFAPMRRTYVSASHAVIARRKEGSPYWGHRRPSAAALPRPLASPRVPLPRELLEEVLRSSATLSLSTATTSMGTRLRRNYITAACPRLFAEEMCNFASIVFGAVASSRMERHMQASVLVSELQNTAASAAVSPSSAPLSGVAAEASLWRSYMHPFARFLSSSLDDSAPTDNPHSLCAASLAESKWEEALLDHVCLLASWPDTEAADTVAHLMELLAPSCTRRKSSCAPLLANMESVVRRVVRASSPALLSTVVQACQVRIRHPDSVASGVGAAFTRATAALYTPQAEEDFHGGCRWRAFMSDSAVKVCLQQMVQVLTASSNDRRTERAGGASAVTPAARLQIQQCCLCQIPRHMDDRTRRDCAMLSMTALKQAPFTVLLAAYQYFREEGLVSVVVAQRFLAHCGVCVTHATQRGVSLATYISPAAAEAGAEALLHAHTTVLSACRDSKQLQMTVSYAVAALNALGFPHIVRSLYKDPGPTVAATPASALCETPHSVLSQVLLRNVSGAVGALEALGASRPEGWPSLPLAATESMAAVSRLVGQEGSVPDVDRLYAALVGFHNAGLFVSYYVECVLAGLCDRMRNLGRQQHAWRDARKVPSAAPHQILECVIPVLRATLRYVGDELNADIILELVETALHLREYAVPLTAAIVSALRANMEQSLCLQELLYRVDATTHDAPFLCYYTLCYARDFDSPSTFDHLAALWRIDGDAIWNRAAHLSPSCGLWRCTTCGRLNSDRYNYCVCSALRYSHVICGACGYAQDERLRQCRSCGETLTPKALLAGAVARKAWQCRGCGARNPARQTLLCFRCGQPTGPCIPQHTAAATAESEGGTASSPAMSGCCFSDELDNGLKRGTASAATRAAVLYTAAVGVCHECGRFKMDHAARHSIVWMCAGCHQRRSSLERVCPSCPQVECLPKALCREPVSVPRVCRHCGREEANPFTMVCRGCGSTANPFAHRCDSAETTSLPEQVAAADSHASHVLPQVVASQRQRQVYHWCFHCHHIQACDDSAPLPQQHCSGCAANCEEKGLCLLPVRCCGGCGVSFPARYAGSAVCPYCAAYVELAPQPQRCSDGSAQRYWTAVTLLHTCEVLEGCCARKSLFMGSSTHDTLAARVSATATNTLASDDSAARGTAVSAADTSARAYPQRRPTIEKTLSCVRREWCSIDSAVWLSMRMDVATLLGRAVHRLSPWLSGSLTARRVSALLKNILAHVDSVCGAAATDSQDSLSRTAQGRFSPAEVCRECLGTHPPDLCPFSEDSGLWTCGECGAANNNADVCRYVCGSCLTLRPVVQTMLISACWECHACNRANVQFERYCIHCGVERAAWSAALLPHWDSGGDGAAKSGIDGGGWHHYPADADTVEFGDLSDTTFHVKRRAAGNGHRSVQGYRVGLLGLESDGQAPSQSFSESLPCEASNVAPLDSLAPNSPSADVLLGRYEIPFNPAKCPLCGYVYIEARCPLCLNHITDVADAKGTVCEVQDRCAFIQPSGTTRPQDRIFVNEALLKANALREGRVVHYTAELGQRGRMEARFLRC